MMRKILMTLAFLLAIAQVAWATGELTGKFSVSATKQVQFSQGNLQYIGSADTPYWKFADHQWDYIGADQGGSTASNVDRDLFGWATSGYNHGATSYQPYSTNTAYSNYYAYGNASYNLYDQTGKADWGYNAISNGGNTENSGWRTLTGAEWLYLFDNHTKGWATVNGVGGYVIRPDGVSTAVSSSYTDSEWATEEAAGSVFLPAAGDRDGITVAHVAPNESYGHYWSSSPWAENGAYAVNFKSGVLNPQNAHYRNYGFSVRLVKDVTVYFAAGSGGDGWNISPATPYEGQTVEVSYTGVHKVKNVTVKGKSVVTAAPTANVLTYTGSAQELISAGTATCGTLVYSLTSGSGYSTSIPTATDAGTYTVYYKVDGDSEYTGTGEQSVNVTIAKAAATLSLENTTPLSFTSSQASGTTYYPSHQATFTGGTLTATSANTDNCTVDVNQFSHTIIVTRINNAAFSNTQITVSVTPDDNHTAPDDVTFYVSAAVYSKTFNYDGEHRQTFTAPATGWYTLEAYGAQGGNCGTNNGGKGGYATIKYQLTKDQTLYIYVGEQGHSNDGTTGGSGGWNGGGKGGNGCKWNDIYYDGVAGGGGASHIATIETGSISGNNLQTSGTNAVTGLLLVAGGGGGAGHGTSKAGAGGGYTGEAGQNTNSTLLSSWNNGNNSCGQAGNNGFEASGSAEGSGGGGGGFIGGSANQSTSGANQDYGGSGGRSWGEVTYGKGYSTKTGGATEGGDGKVVITYYGTTYPVSGN